MSGPPRTLNSRAGFFPFFFNLAIFFLTNSWPLVGLGGLMLGGLAVVDTIPELPLAVTFTPIGVGVAARKEMKLLLTSPY